MTPSERIAATAWNEVHTGRLLAAVDPGWCLMGVRLIVEDALGWKPKELYARHGTHRTTQSPAGRTDWSWWAADLERSLKQQGHAIPGSERQAGDLVFNYEAAKPYGHVGVLLTRDVVLEVVDPRYRPASFVRGVVCLSSWSSWPATLVARLPE